MRRKSKFLCLLLFIFFIGFRNVDPVGNKLLRRAEIGNLTQAISTEIYQQFIFTHKVLTAAESIELETVNKKLMDRETEVIDLQKKVIELFEELRHSKATA